jgi:hypothetical protein
MDGTFDSCPALFSGGQLFSIHIFHLDKLLCVVFCLTSTKSTSFYNTLFAILHRGAARLGLQLKPAMLLSDFESGLIPAVANSFPQTFHRGCHFHFCQAIYRQVQSLGLVQAYDSRPEIRLHIRKLMALAFLPVSSVRLTFATLSFQADPILAPLFQYFRHQWMSAIGPSTWNVYGESVRTNNDCEGWHRRFNNAVNTHHPNLWKFLRCLHEEQAAADLLRHQIVAGRVARRHASTYTVIQKRLMAKLKRRFDSGAVSVDEYLEGVSYNLEERH